MHTPLKTSRGGDVLLYKGKMVVGAKCCLCFNG